MLEEILKNKEKEVKELKNAEKNLSLKDNHTEIIQKRGILNLCKEFRNELVNFFVLMTLF